MIKAFSTRTLLLIVMFSSLSAFMLLDSNGSDSAAVRLSVNRGEVLEYKVNFLFMSVGKAQIKTYKNVYTINGQPCYRIDVNGKTTGALDWVAKINDQWGGYVDTLSILPHIGYRNLEEGKYKKKEMIKFDHETKMLEAKVINNKTGEFKEPLYHAMPGEVRDLISGYMYLRAIDFTQIALQDTITVSAFFEDTFYDLQVLFKGREELNTKLGKINALKLVPIMPDNKLFSGENAVTAWFSDDQNKIPLKVEANLVMGSAGVEIIAAEAVRHPINFVKIKKAGRNINETGIMETDSL